MLQNQSVLNFDVFFEDIGFLVKYETNIGIGKLIQIASGQVYEAFQIL